MPSHLTIRCESLDFIDPELVTQWHERDRRWLEVELSKPLTEDRHVVVMTHHLPSLSLIDEQYRDSPLNWAFASATDCLLDFPVRLWVCGHTHVSMCRTLGNGVCVVVNPVGHPDESTGYERALVMEVQARARPKSSVTPIHTLSHETVTQHCSRIQ